MLTHFYLFNCFCFVLPFHYYCYYCCFEVGFLYSSGWLGTSYIEQTVLRHVLLLLLLLWSATIAVIELPSGPQRLIHMCGSYAVFPVCPLCPVPIRLPWNCFYKVQVAIDKAKPYAFLDLCFHIKTHFPFLNKLLDAFTCTIPVPINPTWNLIKISNNL